MPHSSRRFVSGGRAVRPARRKLVWATAVGTHTGVAAAGKFNDDLLANLEVAGSSVLGATIMRTHLSIAITDVTTGAPAMGVYVGLIVSTAPTVTNLDPSTAFGDDWMLLTSFGPGTSNGNVALFGASNVTIYYGSRFDVRSKRKIEELGEKYFLCVQNSGANSVNIGTFTRTLIALP